ncbi:hypothetical protein SAMN05421840_106196 [Shewanella morhuae]|uniref:hypothetical protein n=1 Tax=Shewanella TaxID=22 RepID=UPI000956E6E0|nr:hypothetical protein [Shewanella morhuae]SIQ96809.1 hypothetical protein SAMN05421840_106196 [Shewanella morhuae]
MIKGIGESLTQLRQSQTVTSHYVAPLAASPRGDAKARPIPKHRLETYGRWAKVTQEQHNISASQVVLKSLLSAKELLSLLHRQLQSCLFNKTATPTEAIEQAEQYRQQLLQIQPTYQGKLLLDHHFNLVSVSQPATTHQFRFRRVDLTASKNRDEHITLYGARKTLHLYLPANHDRLALQQIIEPVLAQLEISIDHSISQETVFSVTSERWLVLNKGILMVGEGQRLPAGEPRNIHLEEIFSWQDPREWRFTDIDMLKVTLAKIAKVAKKIALQIEAIQASHRLLLAKAKQLNTVSLPKEDLQYLHKFMQPTPFAYQMISLLAQSNANREQVSALLV